MNRLLIALLCSPVFWGQAIAQTPAAGAPAPVAAPAPTPIVVVPVTPPAAPAAAGPRVVLTPEASAQISEADRLRATEFKRTGTKMFSSGRYKEAIEAFTRAHEITNDNALIYNIAISYQNLQAWQQCVSNFDRFLEHAAIGPKRDRAENARKSCEARIERDQQLVIDTDPIGANVFIDDHGAGVKGQTPFRIFLKPGRHTVWVELKGYEPVLQHIEVQKAEPFRMNLALRRVANRGWIFVDSTVVDAQVYIEGKNVGLTPFREPIAYPAGRYQVIVKRDGYTDLNKTIAVKKGTTTVVDAPLMSLSDHSSWRGSLGWTANVFGVLAIGGGVASYFLAEQEFNDTDEFKQFALFEKLGYGIGGGLLAVGTGLIIWDATRDVIPEAHRNRDYKKPTPPPKTANMRMGVTPRGVSFGFDF